MIGCQHRAAPGPAAVRGWAADRRIALHWPKTSDDL